MDLPIILLLLAILCIFICIVWYMMSSGSKEEEEDPEEPEDVTTDIPDECVPKDVAEMCGKGETKWEPVCGIDGKTYGSKCFADAKCIEVESMGECPKPKDCSQDGIECSEIDMPVCGINGVQYKNSCHAAKECVDVAYRGPCNWLTLCELNPGAFCTADWNPVCGYDGKTYSNACNAHKMCVAYRPGECPSSGTS